MGGWRWFDGILKEAGVEVTDENRERIDEIVHRFIGEKSRYGHCSSDWKKARKEIKADEKMKQELIERLQGV